MSFDDRNDNSNPAKKQIDADVIVDAELVEDSIASVQFEPTNIESSASDSQRVDRLATPRRLHPSSIAFDILAALRKYLIPAGVAIFAAPGGMTGVLLVSLVLGVTLFGILLRYFTLRYRIDQGELIVTQGLFFRRVRTVPMRRIQNIDLVQNLFHRMLKVAEVRVETASGTEPEAVLRVLALETVSELRREILDRDKSKTIIQPDNMGTSESSDSAVDRIGESRDEAGKMLLQIPTAWLVKAGLASNRGMLIVGVVIGAYYQFDLEKRFDIERALRMLPKNLSVLQTIVLGVAVALAAFLLLRLFGIVWYILRFHGYRLTLRDEDLRITCGLMTQVSATVPRRRIQFISLHQPFFLRLMGLATIRIETAGGSGKEGEDATKSVGRRWFVPVVNVDRVNELFNDIRPGLKWDDERYEWKPLSERAPARLSRLAIIQAFGIALVGLAVTRPWGFVAGAMALPLFIMLARRRSRSMRYARTDFGVAYRSGIFDRKTSFTFFERIQTLRLDQSPFDRRWKMATLAVDTAAAGPADHTITIPYLDANFAATELQSLERLAAQHRPIWN